MQARFWWVPFAVAGLSSQAGAEVVSYTQPFDGPLTVGAPFSVSLPRFEIAGATLTGVELSFHVGPSAHVLVENRTSRPGTFAGAFRAEAGFVAPGGAAASSDQFFILFDPIMLEADDGVNWTGSDCANYGRLLLENDLASGVVDAAPYIGSGLFESRVLVSSMVIECSTGLQIESDISQHHLSGEARVTYTYIPAPPSALLLLALVAQRRRVR